MCTWADRKERERGYIQRGRRALIRELGGRCVSCGSTRRLEFDHIFGATYVAREHNQAYRLADYRRCHKLGLLQLLCRKCNSRKGRPQ